MLRFLLCLLLLTEVFPAPKYYRVLFGEPSEILREQSSEGPRPPIILLPGLVSSRLIAWKHKSCRGPDINIQDIVWLNLQKMMETLTYDHHCWIDCMKLGKNSTDHPDCKLRPDEGLSAVGELSPGNIYTPPATSIFTQLIKMLAYELGYDSNNIIGAPYDWRLAPMQLQQRDLFLTTLKLRIETAVKRHRRPAIVIAHSMGNSIFLYFCDWLKYEDKPAMGADNWLRKHIWGYIAIAAPLLGAPGAIKSVLSGHTFGLTVTEAQARELELTFSSTHFMNPRSSQPSYNNFTHDYNEPIVTIKSSSGGSQVSFGIDDIENGEIFKWVGNMFKEPEMLEKYDVLRHFYINDPLKPLEKLHTRPNVKHVVVVYGVDIDTEVGYTYRIAEGANPGPPILEEIFYERPCKRKGKRIEEESYDESCPDITLLDDYTSTIKLSDSTALQCVSKKILENDSDSTKNEYENDNYNEKKKKRSPGKECKTEIYSALQTSKINSMTQSRRRFVRNGQQHHSGDYTVPYMSLSFAHTWLDGPDNVRWEEYRPEVVHKNILDKWAPSKMASAVATIDPAVELFYSLDKKTGDTTVVMEFSGVDHLDIAKHPFVHTVVFEYLLPKMGDELCLNQTCEAPIPSEQTTFMSSYNLQSIIPRIKEIFIEKLTMIMNLMKYKITS